jgi:indole-3-glycerol phosphate synthase
MTRLDEIVRQRRIDLELAKGDTLEGEIERLAKMAFPPLDFLGALKNKRRGGAPVLIAEIKRASPSRGNLSAVPEPVELARRYRDNGAAAVSVLTESRFFKGSLRDLQSISSAGLGIPVLRKDFILDPWQVYEARVAGADAVLLIVAGLDPEQLELLQAVTMDLGMTALVEVHNRRELEIALACHPRLVGINNRNLANFEISLETTCELRPLIPAEIAVVAESGIHGTEDVLKMQAAGVDAILVGEALVTAKDIDAQVRSLAGFER